jgi:hypothetical protein
MKQPFCRLVFVLGAVGDIKYDEVRSIYHPVAEVGNQQSIVCTPWQINNETLPAASWQLTSQNWPANPGTTLILSAGIEYGQPVAGGLMKYTKYSGAGKIMKVG